MRIVDGGFQCELMGHLQGFFTWNGYVGGNACSFPILPGERIERLPDGDKELKMRIYTK